MYISIHPQINQAIQYSLDKPILAPLDKVKYTDNYTSTEMSSVTNITESDINTPPVCSLEKLNKAF